MTDLKSQVIKNFHERAFYSAKNGKGNLKKKN